MIKFLVLLSLLSVPAFAGETVFSCVHDDGFDTVKVAITKGDDGKFLASYERSSKGEEPVAGSFDGLDCKFVNNEGVKHFLCQNEDHTIRIGSIRKTLEMVQVQEGGEANLLTVDGYQIYVTNQNDNTQAEYGFARTLCK